MSEFKNFYFRVTESTETLVSVRAPNYDTALVKVTVGPLERVLNKCEVSQIHCQELPRRTELVAILGDDSGVHIAELFTE